LAGTAFAAERLSVRVLAHSGVGELPSPAELVAIEREQQGYAAQLTIPRRPAWTRDTPGEALQQRERDAFLAWRRRLAALESNAKLTMTPYERNLEVWRQLWRVVERSDVVVQLVDARNPLLFRSDDLEQYVCEVDSTKANLLVVNKADLLSEAQRAAWAAYLSSRGVCFAFWSALNEADAAQEEEEEEEQSAGSAAAAIAGDAMDGAAADCMPGLGGAMAALHGAASSDAGPALCTPRLLGRREMLALLRAQCRAVPSAAGPTRATVGLVGYPNVGKSSTINALVGEKKVSVSVTPGRTKHFQTIVLDDGMVLCDCPGLVFPTFVTTKADMVCNGILPIDQLREPIAPCSLVAQRIPRHLLERLYGIRLPEPGEGEDAARPPTAHELLAALGAARGCMEAHGSPDEMRAARRLLKDYVSGRILYCPPPPRGRPGRLCRHDTHAMVDLPQAGRCSRARAAA
jgi:large subunit GTPase 1